MTDKTPTKKQAKPAKGKVAPKRQRVDWDAIKRDYRTDKFTDMELAARYDVSRETISRKRASDEKQGQKGWEKDLREAIKQATDAALVRDIVTEHHTKVTDVILVAAEVNSQVILGHRTGLKRLTTIQQKLLDQIEQAASNLPELADVIEMARNPDEHGKDAINDQMRKAMGRSSLVDDLKKLAEVDERVRKGEREAFGLNTEAPPESEIAGLLKNLGSRSAFQVVK